MTRRCFLQVLTSLGALLLVACIGCAQTSAKVAPAGPAKAQARMTVEDVVRLSRAGVSEEIILAQIREKHQAFDLTADQLIELKSASVGERVIRMMMEAPAPAAIPLKPATTPAAVQAAAVQAPVQWITHTDPMGFSLSSPAGWDVRADRQLGRIQIQGPQGQQAIIWPMFVPGQQLDLHGAGIMVQQLARRVDAKLAWGEPQLTGNTARVFARGQNSGAALMRWSSSADGTSVYLFCVTASASIYQASVDT